MLPESYGVEIRDGGKFRAMYRLDRNSPPPEFRLPARLFGFQFARPPTGRYLRTILEVQRTDRERFRLVLALEDAANSFFISSCVMAWPARISS